MAKYDKLTFRLVLTLILFPLFLFQCSPVRAATVTSYTVYDGDTLTHADVDVFPNMRFHGSLRIRGIDTPEIHTRSACEKMRGYQARDALKGFLDGKTITAENAQNGKYAGRVLADVFADGESVAEWMLKHSYARPYFGGKRDRRWCNEVP